MGLLSSTRQHHTRCALSCPAAGRQRGGREGCEGGDGTGQDGRGVEGRGGDGTGRDGRGVEGRGGEGRGGEGRGGEGRGGEGRGGKGSEGNGREWKGANFTGGILMRELASIQYIHKPSHYAVLALETFVLQIKNSEQV